MPPDVDITVPSIARVYDYYLGGFHNFAADREVAERTIAAMAGGTFGPRANRSFLGRAVRECVAAGVTQFLDIGSGIPTVGNVHEVAQSVCPDARVVYVEIDPIAVRHSEALLAGDDRTGVLRADLRDPARILGDPVVTGLLDFDRPVALLLVAVLHFVADSDDPAGIVAYFRDRLAPGSLLVLSHGTNDDIPPDNAGYSTYQSAVSPLVSRSRDEVVRLFDGFELWAPGVEWVTRWRPCPEEDLSATGHVYGGVGVKPAGSVHIELTRSAAASVTQRQPEGERPDWAPAIVDIHTPSIARVYDYFLGGSHNFAADREAARRLLAAGPDGALGPMANRAFLRRAVRYCVESGVRQFLDIGSGIPTAGNVHTVAQGLDAGCRVVYVDVDPVAFEHGRAILAGQHRTGVVRADVRDPERILADPVVTGLLDLDRPVALLLVAVLHFVTDADEAAAILDCFRHRLAPGSLLVLSHGTEDDLSVGEAGFMSVYGRNVSPVVSRSKAEVTRMFEGFELVEPGVEWAPRWRPDPDEDTSVTAHFYCGVGRKPVVAATGEVS